MSAHLKAYDVFISYAGEDEAVAERLRRRLVRFKWRGRNLRVAFAPNEIGGGQSIPGRLLEMMEESSCTVAVVTPAWRASKWCRLEQETATWVDPATDIRRLLPVMLRSTELPTVLARIKYVDFRDPSKFDQCLKELVGDIRSNLEAAVRSGAARDLTEAMLRSSLLPWIGPASPSMRLIWPEMIVDPEVISHRSVGKRTRLKAAREQLGEESKFVILMGEPGSGKSIALRSVVLEGARGAHGSARRLCHAREELPFENGRDEEELTPEFLAIDGLDEVTVRRASRVLSLAGQLAEKKQITVWLSSRTDFLFRYAPQFKEHWQRLDEVLEITPWTPDDAKGFAANYLEKTGHTGLRDVVLTVLGDARHQDVLLNPMRLTLLLYIATTSRQRILPNLQEPFNLYERFYIEWLGAETARGTTQFPSHVVTSAHIQIARWLYQNRGFGYPTEKLKPKELAHDTAFVGLLEPNASVSSIGQFRHETIGEFLIAKSIVDSFKTGGAAIDDALALTVGDDVNVFARSGLVGLPPVDSDGIVENLLARYAELRACDATAHTAKVREQVLYYLGRTDNPKSYEDLERAANEETNPLLKRAAILGCILAGNHSVEDAYIKGLWSSNDEDLLNRSVQMCYFGDVSDDLHTFRDIGGDWSRTKVAIVRRLGLQGIREQKLRWWDLATLASFGRSRGEIRFTSDELETVSEARGSLSGPVARTDNMNTLLDEILSLARTAELTPAADTEPWLSW